MWNARSLAALVCVTQACLAADIFVLGVESRPVDGGSPVATELTILNRGAAATSVTIGFVSTAKAALPDPFVQSLAPGQSFQSRDVLAELWDLNSAGGVIRVSSDGMLAVSAVKYRQPNSGGRVGAVLPVVREASLLGAGESGDTIWVIDSQRLPGAPGTTIRVLAADPDSQVDVAILGPDGVSRASATVVEGPVLQDFFVSSLTSDLPIGKARIQVRAGRAWAWTEILYAENGDLLIGDLTPDSRVAADLTALAASRETTDEGFSTRTNIRMFNPAARAMAITATFGVTPARSFGIGPGALLEIGDILATLGAPAGAQGPLRLQAPTPFLASARTIVTQPATGPTPVGEVHAAAGLSSRIPAGQTAIAIGLTWDGARTYVVASTSDAGATASLILHDPDGAVLATQAAYAIDPGAARRDDLASLFPGATVFPGGWIEIQVTSGAMLAGIWIADIHSGDVFFRALQPGS